MTESSRLTQPLPKRARYPFRVDSSGGHAVYSPAVLRRLLKWIAVGLGLFLLAALVASFVFVPPYVDRRVNRVSAPSPYPTVSRQAARVHAAATIVDLHADSLIWGRDLLSRSNRGQVDLPRLLEANVALQVFSVPTKVPRIRGSGGGDPNSLNLITLSAIMQLWSPSSWFSLRDRAIYLAGDFQRLVQHSQGRLQMVRNRKDIELVLGPGRVGGLLALEGLHCLEGDPSNLERLFKAGYRMAGIVHQFDNRLGGSSYGVQKGGLTPLGEQVVTKMNQLGMIIDLAHASPSLIEDVLRLSVRPVVVSHTGVRGTCDRPRNLSDDQLRAVAQRGGLIGIGFWAGATCGTDAQAVARSVRHAVEVVGVERVALGSDFDGDRMPFDVTGLPMITEALLGQGFTEQEIYLLLGANAIRFLKRSLPPE